ncbi:MAG: HNH endonuclease family protein [Marmoricola sp.]
MGWSSYRFRYRTSVEHFYPQHPDPGGNIEPLGRAIVDLFGNLCLMSRSENSKRSNLAPEAKVGQYRSDAQSLKFQLMAAVARDEGWREEQIRAHGEAMLTILSGLKSPPEATASKESTA